MVTSAHGPRLGVSLGRRLRGAAPAGRMDGAGATPSVIAMPITCPATDHTFEAPAVRVGPVGICPVCGRSIAFDEDGSVRLATAADTVPLTEPERNLLRKARGRKR